VIDPEDGHAECLRFAARIMDVLKITPPFFYSYQCGSFLLTSYIPVYMYSISLQILSTILVIAFAIFSSTRTRYPHWLLKSLPGVYLPSHWNDIDRPEMNPDRLLNPHQIISGMLNNIILLLSFGLCCPVLCCYIALSICVNLSCWLFFINQFVRLRIDALVTSQRLSEDQLFLLLEHQLHGVSSSLSVCKWPIILTSCFFVTLLGWDIAGDQGGWFEALWVPIVGVVIVTVIWIWDQVSISGEISDWASSFSFSLCSLNRHSEVVDVGSLELVHSSLHQHPSVRVVDEEGHGPNQFAF
jgi:hypothetical protein